MIRTCALCSEPAKYRGVGGTPLCSEHSKDQFVEPITATLADLVELRERLVTFARGLAAEQWYSSSSYESTTEDKIREAVADCKASIGRALCEALGVKP